MTTTEPRCVTAPTVLSDPSTPACCVAVCDISGARCTRTGCDGVHDVEGRDCWTDTPNDNDASRTE